MLMYASRMSQISCGTCRFWFYGDDAVESRLKKLSEYLDAFEPRNDIESLVPVQPLFSEPKKAVNYYAAGEEKVRSSLL
jgi:Zn-dependent M16 (insulinase) family peptidase